MRRSREPSPASGVTRKLAARLAAEPDPALRRTIRKTLRNRQKLDGPAGPRLIRRSGLGLLLAWRTGVRSAPARRAARLLAAPGGTGAGWPPGPRSGWRARPNPFHLPALGLHPPPDGFHSFFVEGGGPGFRLLWTPHAGQAPARGRTGTGQAPTCGPIDSGRRPGGRGTLLPGGQGLFRLQTGLGRGDARGAPLFENEAGEAVPQPGDVGELHARADLGESVRQHPALEGTQHLPCRLCLRPGRPEKGESREKQRRFRRQGCRPRTKPAIPPPSRCSAAKAGMANDGRALCASWLRRCPCRGRSEADCPCNGRGHAKTEFILHFSFLRKSSAGIVFSPPPPPRGFRLPPPILFVCALRYCCHGRTKTQWHCEITVTLPCRRWFLGGGVPGFPACRVGRGRSNGHGR